MYTIFRNAVLLLLLLYLYLLKALSTVGRCNTSFEEYWQYVLKRNMIRVPEGCPTMNQAMELAVIFSEEMNARESGQS
jgi:hypothetical protein